MRLKLICAVLVGVLLIAPGCGSKKKSTTTKTTTPTTTTSASGGTTLTGNDCEKLAAASATVGQALSGKAPGDINTQIARMNELAKVAPKAVQSDFAELAKAASEFAKLNLKPGQQLTAAQLHQLMAKMDLPKLTQASQHLSTWATTHCTKK